MDYETICLSQEISTFYGTETIFVTLKINTSRIEMAIKDEM